MNWLQGAVELLADHTICTAGQKLGPHQAALLRIFGQRQAEFSISLLCCWHRQGVLGRSYDRQIPGKYSNLLEHTKQEQNKVDGLLRKFSQRQARSSMSLLCCRHRSAGLE